MTLNHFLQRIFLISIVTISQYGIGQVPDNLQLSDTSGLFVVDSIYNDLGELTSKSDPHMVKYFQYIGEDTLTIAKVFTSDPHYICRHPNASIVPNEIYPITICFFLHHKVGPMRKTMGFRFTNGEVLQFYFKGMHVKE